MVWIVRAVGIAFAVCILSLLWVAYGLLKPVHEVQVDTDFSSGNTVHLLAIGDQGVGNLRQWQVADAMQSVAEQMDVSAVVTMGDNFYPRGVDSPKDIQWRYKFENVYQGSLSQTPFFATLGNHDYKGNELAQVEYARKAAGSGRWQMPSRDYLHTFGSDTEQALVRIAFIDTGLYWRDPHEVTTKLNQLLSDAPRAYWTLVVTHTPLVSGNVTAHQEGAHELWQRVLQKHSVDAVVAGHDHNMQFIERTGWPASIILGVGGKSGQGLELDGVEGLQFYGDETGFGVLSAQPEQLLVRYLNSDGQVLFEHAFSHFSGDP